MFLGDLAGVFGLGAFDGPDLTELVLRLGFDLLVTAIVIRAAYRDAAVNGSHELACFMFNAITFLVCFLLRKVPVELGFALGLFAVFGILRYRTEALRARDLTYLFVALGIAILNAMANEYVSLAELALVNFVIAGGTVVLELRRPPALASQRVLYDNLTLLRGRNKEQVAADLSERTGLKVLRLEIERIDLLRDTAEVRVYYEDDWA